MYVPYKKAGNGDLIAGFEKLNPMPYPEARKLVTHPVACIDCHDPTRCSCASRGRVSSKASRALKTTTEGIDNYDVEHDGHAAGDAHLRVRAVSRRVLLPRQGKAARLSVGEGSQGRQHPRLLRGERAQGLGARRVTGAHVLKAQHPEFEMYNQGMHARSGVACADCHMPYKREGAMKISDHHVRSPLLNVNSACQTCHKWTEEELLQRAQTIQDRNYEMRNIAMDALVELINEIGAAAKRDSASAAVKSARAYQRKAQFLLDFIEAENSMGFHAPQEAARILTNSLNYTRMGQVAIRGGTPAPLKSYPAPQPATQAGAVERKQ